MNHLPSGVCLEMIQQEAFVSMVLKLIRGIIRRPFMNMIMNLVRDVIQYEAFVITVKKRLPFWTRP
jgi:hypothetical protein